MSDLATAISILENNAKPIRDAVLNGNSVPWFGSGISRERFPGVPKLIEELLTLLHSRAAFANPACPYAVAIREILSLAGGVIPVDGERPPADWPEPERKNILRLLAAQYAPILGMSINGPLGTESVRWDILNLVDKYSDPTILPDAEHVLISVLIAEGLWPDCITTNWDGLIEIAAEQCGDGVRPPLHVVACNEEMDLADHCNSPRLYKIHGCARKSRSDANRYKRFMIATDQELATWTGSEDFRAFREVMHVTTRERPVLCVGLSAQDFNLKVTLISSTLGRAPFDPALPRIAFSEEAFSNHHRAILNGFYTENVVNENFSSIKGNAIIGLYAKPLLAGIYVELVFARAEVILQKALDLRGDSQATVSRWLTSLKELLVGFYDCRVAALGSDEMWRAFARELPMAISTLVTLYRNQSGSLSSQAYSPLVPSNLAAMRSDANLAAIGFQWLIWAGAILGKGHDDRKWRLSVELTTLSHPTPLRLVDAVGTRPLFLIGDAEAGMTRLTMNGLLAGGPAVVMYPNGSKPARATRSPGRRLSVRGKPDPVKEVWMRDLYEDSLSDDDVLESLRMELA